MRLRPEVPRMDREHQRGFSLMEVMFASLILSVFILGVGKFWYSASVRAADLVLRQKAIFALNAEVERITAMYVYTGFAADLLNGPVTTTGYDGLAAIPTTRLIYPINPSAFANSDFVTTSAANFATAPEFVVWVDAGALPSVNRAYVWLDKSHGIVGRISWVETPINVSSCIETGNCYCQPYGLLGDNHCRRLDVYLEYPYRFTAATGAMPPASFETLSIKTIVGRG